MEIKIIGRAAVICLVFIPVLPFSLAAEAEDSGGPAAAATPGQTSAPAVSPAPAEERPTLAARAAAGEIIWLSDWSEGRKKNPAPAGWQLDEKKTPVDISLSGRGEDSVLRMRSQNSAFGIYLEEELKIKEYPYLNWEWKVTELPAGGSFLDKDTDDQAAQVYISFGSLSLFNKPFVKAIGYYWSSTVPVGTEGECPTWGKSRVIVLRSGGKELGQWQREKRDVGQDYKRLFHDDSPAAGSALRLYTNSQHTKSATGVFFRNIYFSKE